MVDYINKSMRTKKGFTLVEVVAVVIVLAIIAAVAIPRYADMRTNANQASVNSVAAGLGSASADNFTRRSSNSALGTAVANCTTIALSQVRLIYYRQDLRLHLLLLRRVRQLHVLLLAPQGLQPHL